MSLVTPLAIFVAISLPASLGPYANFIAAAYLLVALVLALLIGWIAIDYRTQRRRLSDLEAGGATRRSGRSATDIK
jgi:heme exporter protein D